MDFWFEKETPANTAKEDALKTVLKVTSGEIRQVWFYHPPGCAGLAYATIWEGGHQLYPTNPEAAYHGDGQPMSFPDNYKLPAEAQLKLKTWNVDDTYPHTVYVRLTVIRVKKDPMQQVLIDLVKIMKRMLGVH